jgi:hypothetical protein
MEASNISYTFPPFLAYELEEEVKVIEKKCSTWSADYSTTKEEIQKELIERMVEQYNLTAKSPLKLVKPSFYDTVRSANPQDPTQWNWDSWNAKLTSREYKSYKNNGSKFQEVLRKIAWIICSEINWSEQVNTLKALQTQDGISPNKIYEAKNFFEIIINYSQTLTPITNLVKGMISNGFLTRQTIDAIYSCVIDK